MTKQPLLMIGAIALLALSAPALARPTTAETTEVRHLTNSSPVPDSSSSLTRYAVGVNMTLRTSGLPPGDATTAWWVVFNHPELCTHGVPGLARCGPGDLQIQGGEAAIGSSVLYATGHIVGGTGVASYASHLSVGQTAGALFGPGLTDPLGAEVHLVVRSHGPVVPQLVYDQTHTFGGGCGNAPPGTGPNTCTDLQFAAHVR